MAQYTKMTKKVPIANRYIEFLNIYSALFNKKLSEKEIGVLNALYWQGGILTTEVRKKMQEQLGITDFNLNNYFSKLRPKGVLIMGENKVERLPKHLMLTVRPEDANTNFLFVLQHQEEENGQEDNKGKD